MRLLALILVAACMRGPAPERTLPGQPNVRMVRHVWQPRADQWRRSPWYLPTLDVVTPMRVVISVDGWACIMPNFEVAEPRYPDHYRCEGDGWRRPRLGTWG